MRHTATPRGVLPSTSFELSAGRYRSLHAPLRWTSIPPFAVICGENGSGKSQLLSLMAEAISRNATGPAKNALYETCWRDLDCGPTEYAYMRAQWSAPDSAPSHLRDLEQQRLELAKNLLKRDQTQPYLQQLRSELGPVLDSAPTPEQLAPLLAPRMLLEINPSPAGLLQHLGHVFRDDHLDRLQRELMKEDPAVTRRELGAPPWEIANEILQASSIPYRLTTPHGLGIKDVYSLRLVAEDTKVTIPHGQLSDGEKVLFVLLCMIFGSRQYGKLPRLLLLDEPDAHLHTAQIAPFLSMLRGTLVEEYGCRVIMTTHRPDTVVLLREGELFEMRRAELPRLVPANGPSRIVGRMTAHLIDVLPSVSCVFVEDDDDVAFYEAIERALQVEHELGSRPSFTFLTPSVGAGRAKTGAGSSVVRSTVEKLRRARLDMVAGIVDGDDTPGGTAVGGVHRLSRHSIENFIFDPLHVFALLMDHGAAPPVPGVAPFRSGDEARLRAASEFELQAIADSVVVLFEREIPASRRAHAPRRDAVLIDGRSVGLPEWVFSLRGHDLRHAAHNVDKRLTRAELLRTMARTRLVYADIRDILRLIQARA